MNNTIKKITIISMALVLCVCCITPSFSWYNHNSTSPVVNAVEYNRESLPVSGYVPENNLSMTTYLGSIDEYGEVSYYNTPLDDSDDITAEASDDKNKYKTTCYKSVIKNTSEKDVRVGLYLETAQFGNDEDSVCYGTSDPIWRRITSGAMNTKITPKKISTGTMRVYFENNESVWSETSFYVVAYRNDYNHKLYTMAKCPSESTLYYADIPSTSTAFFVTCEEDLVPSRDYRRTIEIQASEKGISPTSTKKISLTGNRYNDKYMFAEVSDLGEGVTGANIAKFPEKLYLSTNSLNEANKGSVALSNTGDSIDYIGSKIEYESNNTGVATVDNSGTVTGLTAGTAVITTTVTGTKGDTYQVKTTVNVQNPKVTLPLVQNILVPKNGEASVCWYIDNKTTEQLKNIKLMLTL